MFSTLRVPGRRSDLSVGYTVYCPYQNNFVANVVRVFFQFLHFFIFRVIVRPRISHQLFVYQQWYVDHSLRQHEVERVSVPFV